MLLVFDLIFFILQPVQASGENTLLIGLDADMSSGSAQAGVAIERGALISIEEINQKGGVVGHFLKQVVNVHRGNPARGIDNINELGKMDK